MAKNDNSSLGSAKRRKNDEFYTRGEDIQEELRHYKGHFRGKTVLCNYDNPRVLVSSSTSRTSSKRLAPSGMGRGAKMQSEMYAEGHRIPELVYMRSFAILCIVLHHAICAFGCWPPNSPLSGQVLPFWLRELSSLAKVWGLSSFTFIAGFCTVQSLQLRGRFSFVLRKIDLLLIPCGFWGLLYWRLFPSMMLSNSPVNGTHLWYIPMILLCFAAVAITPTRFVPKVIFLGMLFCVGAIVDHYLAIHATLVNYTSSSFRPFREFISYFPVYLFGFVVATLRERWTFPKIWTGMGLFVVASFFCAHFPRSVLWYLTVQSNMLCWAGSLFVFFACLAAKCDPYPLIASLDEHSFGIYLGHQFFLNACLLLLGMFPSRWSIELPIVFSVALGGAWISSCGWKYLRRLAPGLGSERNGEMCG